MAGNLARINLGEVAEALWQYFEDSVAVHQDLAGEIAARNRGLMDDYVSRNRGLWSRMLGRLREAGMDAPEAIIGAGALVALGAAVSFALTARKR